LPPFDANLQLIIFVGRSITKDRSCDAFASVHTR
jgi:hypothetical protein